MYIQCGSYNNCGLSMDGDYQKRRTYALQRVIRLVTLVYWAMFSCVLHRLLLPSTGCTHSVKLLLGSMKGYKNRHLPVERNL
jgi:hypothetical protein